MGYISRLGSKLLDFVRNRDGSYFIYDRSANTSFLSSKYLKIAQENPVLNSLINIRADYLSKVKFYQLINGERVEDTEVIKLLNNPNPHQSKEDFLKQFEWFCLTSGWVYQKPYYSTGDKIPKSIFNLINENIEFPRKLGNYITWTNKDKNELYSKQFIYKDFYDKRNIKFSEIIPFYDQSNGIINNEEGVLTSPSRIGSIIKSLSNIDLALNAENKVIQSNGREIIQSKALGSNTGVSLPADDKDKKDINEKLNRDYNIGIGGMRTIVPVRALERIDLTTKLSDLGLHASIESNSNIVAQCLQVPNEIYKAYKTGDTFENKKQAELNFIESVMQPRADNIAKSYTSMFGLEQQPIIASFDHLGSKQIQEEKRAERVLKMSVALRNLVQSGMTVEDAKLFMEDNGISNE